MFKIPVNNQINQLNESEFSGILSSTRNIDLSDYGIIKLAPFTFSIASQLDDAKLDGVSSMFSADGNWEKLVVASDDTFSIDIVTESIGASLTNETTSESAPTPGANDDVIYFNGDWVVSDGGSVYRRDNGSWTAITGTPVSATNPNVFAKFPYQNSMLIANSNEVALVDSDWNVVVTLDLPERYIVKSMDTNGAYAYIGVEDSEANEGALFRWLGAGEAHNGMHPVNAYSVDSVTRYQQSVACVTNYGELLYFNGSGMARLAKFPPYDKSTLMSGGLSHNRGMIADGDKIYILTNSRVGNEYSVMMENGFGGVWCFDPKIGLYHKYSTSRNKFLEKQLLVGNVDVNTDTITSSDVPPTGTAVVGSNLAAIGGIKNRYIYYIIKVSDTEFKLATSQNDAADGVAIDLTSDVGEGQTVYIYFLDRNDFGVSLISSSQGAISKLPNEPIVMKEPAFACDTYDNELIDQTHICVSSPHFENRGEVVTSRIKPNLSSMFELEMKYKKLMYGDKIIVKYRTEDDIGRSKSYSLIGLTWTSTNTFTTAMLLDDIVAGDEVFITAGQGAGQAFTVSDISSSSGTYTVTIEETNSLVEVGDRSVASFSNWKKVTELDYQDDLGYKHLTIDAGYSPWIQFKIELQGIGTSIYDLTIDETPIKMV